MTKEDQRYGRDKSTVVNKSYIESGEYRRKFDSDAQINALNVIKKSYDIDFWEVL